MKICENGSCRELTGHELAELENKRGFAGMEHRKQDAYDEAVDARIRERYSISQEFSILRQREEKPEEYAAYYAWCEACKACVKGMMAAYSA